MYRIIEKVYEDGSRKYYLDQRILFIFWMRWAVDSQTGKSSGFDTRKEAEHWAAEHTLVSTTKHIIKEG